MTKRRKTVKHMTDLQRRVEAIANREADRPLQKGDRVRVTRELMPHCPDYEDLRVLSDTEGYIKFTDHINGLLCVIFDGWLARLVDAADLERIAEQDSEEIE